MTRIGVGIGIGLLRPRGASVPVFDPTSVAGAFSILDANTLSATANLAAWPDSVVAGPGATATGTQRPVVNATAANGLPSVQFNLATTTHVLTMGAFSGLTAAHMLIVLRTKTDPQSHGILWDYSGGTVAGSQINFSDGAIYDSFGSSARHDGISPGSAMNVLNIYEVITTSSEWTCKLNGTQLFTTATNTVLFAASNSLGAFDTVGSGYWQGDVPFIGIWNAKLSAGNASYLRAGLKARYGTP